MTAALVATLGETVERLPMVMASSLVAEDLGDVEYLLPGLIPKGAFVVLYGSPKAGKTTLAMHMAAALAGAQEFDGGKGFHSVAWLDLEQPRRTTQRRLREVRAHCSMADFTVYQGAPPALSEVLGAIDHWKPAAVFVDSLSRWLRLESENDNAELNRVLGPVLTAFQARDVSLVVIHHDRKSEGEGGRNMRGASSLLAMCDVAIEVKVEGGAGSTLRKLNLVSRHEGQRSMLLRLTADGFASEESPDRKRDEEILAALAGGPQTLADLETKLGLTGKSLRPPLDALTLRGRVARSGAGKKGDPFTYSLAGILGDSGKSGNPTNPMDSGNPFPSLREGRNPRTGIVL